MPNLLDLKVLFITPYIDPAYGGISKIVLELVAALGRYGIQVDLVTTNANIEGKLNVPLGGWLRQGTYRVLYFPSLHKNDFIFSHGLLLWLQRHVHNYDIVHTHTVFSPLMSFCQGICLWKKVPYVVTPHGMLEPWAMQYKSYKKKAYFNFLEKTIINRAALVQGTASVEAKNVQHLLPQSVVKYVPNGINPEQFLQAVPSKNLLLEQFPELNHKRLILFLGRIDPKKGLDLLAPAFAEVRQQVAGVHLVIAGPDNIGYLPQAKGFFDQANCLEAVTFTGMLTGQLKHCAFAAAEIYVAPSYSEGFSMSILEGLAYGLPCIITKGCNFPEAQEHDVARVVDIDAEAIATALTGCLENPHDAMAMASRASEFIFEHYTWDKVAATLAATYLEISGQTSHALPTLDPVIHS